MNQTMISAALGAIMLLGGTGCSNTVRYMSATRWMTTGGGAPAPAPAAGGAAAPGPADDGRAFYLTFWEGSCSSGVMGFGKGCSLGDSKIRRCNVKEDNSMVCVDEMEANRAFAREQK